MSDDHDHGDVRYLAAKRSVDDRCVNPRVRDATVAALPARPAVYDAGAGTGAWFPRLFEWGVTPATYHGVDTDSALVTAAREARAEELAARGLRVDRDAAGDFVAGETTVRFTAGDALANAPDGTADLVMAGSFLDLVPVADALARFDAATTDGGVVYAPATFDGGTFFAPTHPVDDLVERLYHADIERVSGRSVTAAREAVAAVQAGTGELLAVGSSDWVVRPTDGSGEDDGETETNGVTDDSATDDDRDDATEPGVTDGDRNDSDATDGDRNDNDATDGNAPDAPSGYPGDEAYFLDRILGYVADTLLAREVTRLSTIDPTDARLSAFAREQAPDRADAIRDWLTARRASFRAGELVYVAHQLDMAYRP